MNGKEKCEFLRNIRKNMAEANGINYEPFKCEHEGDCSGTCAYCENEASELLEEIKEKQKAGQPIRIDQEAIDQLEDIANNDANSPHRPIESFIDKWTCGIVFGIGEDE